ncbi:PhoH family protein [Trichlorobacter lovleyi]|uniref:PhoH family protein n=2 Tax=Trichlorobacter lovleyi TaxID=313985 RepID=B3E4U5_TRIL1|nr:PhoH family protein [Trichlorobacter lovleyi]ACD96031.1 PhoH family protein [Trichlorobacter lovleyi SZ]
MKFFILDTNVLLHDPQALFKFEDNTIIIPITVIEEIDRFKKDMNETGRNARSISRVLDMLREKGSLSSGVSLPGGGLLRVELCEEQALNRMPKDLRDDKGDNRILAVAQVTHERFPDETVIFVTKDTNLRIKADAIGLVAEDYESDKVDIQELYAGARTIDMGSDSIDRFYGQGWLEAPEGLLPNEYATLVDTGNPSHTALCRFDAATGKVVPVRKVPKEGVWSIHARNREQQFALDALVDDNIKLVSLVGKAGTGKTLMAIAAGLQKVAEENVYNRLLVSRPVFPMGKDLGFLPGDIEEKLTPWMQPIFDNVELLISGHESEKRHSNKGYKELMAMGLLDIEPLTYIRGRSIPNQYLIVDEAQNLTPHEIKTIVTRAGEGTKIILTGDPYQIDNPYVDSSSNGLSYLVERFKNERISAHVTLTRGERSELAELAANLL